MNFKKFWERARSEPGLGKNLIAYAALVLVGTLVGGYFLAHERFNPPWEDKYSVYAMFDQAAGVSPGNGQEVRIAGVEVGDIRAAELGEDGKAKLELRIDKDQVIYKDARLLLRPKSPLNDMYVEINPGTADAGVLKDGATIPVENTTSPVQVDEVLGHLDTTTQEAMTTLLAESDVALVSAPKTLPPGLDQTKGLLQDLEPVMDRLQTRRKNLARLVNALADVSAAAGTNDQRLERMANSLNVTLSTIAGQSGNLDATLKQLPGLSQELRSTSSRVTQLATQLDPTLANIRKASDELPGALRSFNSSVDELDNFITHARPVLDKAGPVVKDLRIASPDVRRVAGDLRPISADTKPLTAQLVGRSVNSRTAGLTVLDDLSAFVYNTNSLASMRDANKGIIRGLFNISPESITGLMGALGR